jgi:hypothetical protein
MPPFSTARRDGDATSLCSLRLPHEVQQGLEQVDEITVEGQSTRQLQLLAGLTARAGEVLALQSLTVP